MDSTYVTASKALSALLGTFMVGIGIWALASPAGMVKTSGIGQPAHARGPYVLLFGAREVTIGSTILLLGYFNEWRALGVALSALQILAVLDWCITGTHGAGGWKSAALQHGPVMPVAGAVAYVLIQSG